MKLSDNSLVAFLEGAAVEGDLIPLAAYQRAARKFSVSFKDIEEAILKNGLFPLRYQRQRKLLASGGATAFVAVTGCRDRLRRLGRVYFRNVGSARGW